MNSEAGLSDKENNKTNEFHNKTTLDKSRPEVEFLVIEKTGRT
jgi:hypothetical protein